MKGDLANRQRGVGRNENYQMAVMPAELVEHPTAAAAALPGARYAAKGIVQPKGSPKAAALSGHVQLHPLTLSGKSPEPLRISVGLPNQLRQVVLLRRQLVFQPQTD